MPKAVLSNRIYMDVNDELLEKVTKELTYTIPPIKYGDMPITIKTIKTIKNNIISIPIGRQDLIPNHYEVKDKRILAPVEFKDPKLDLYESQEEIFNQITDNCLINAKVSWGKTFTGLYLAKKLGQKTLVVTHTTAIRSQWEKEHKKLYGFKPGLIGSGHFNISTPIVIGNIQTLYNNLEQISQQFGTIIVDEVHRVPAKTFSTIVDGNYSRYKIGLSGTLERKDGKHVVIYDYFGSTVYSPKKDNSLDPSIEIIRTDIRFMDGSSIPWAVRVNDLCNNEDYRQLVALIASAKAAIGHKVLVVADRVHFLNSCAELVGDMAISITGTVPYEERDKLESQLIKTNKKIVFGTQKIFSEGISVPPLSCLILATPVNNDPLLKQLIGRIIRLYPGKLNPVVVDINLKGNTAQRQARNRLGVYIKEGHPYKFIKA